MTTKILTRKAENANNCDEGDNIHLYLNDETMNSYMDLINARSPDTVYAFNTFFYSSLSANGYQHVSRWTKKVDIFNKRKLLIPIHLEEEEHWCLACVDFIERSIKYYDSLRGRNFKCLKRILKYLMLEHIDKKKTELVTGGWLLMNMTKCPKQLNLWDCGVFACMFAEYLSRDAPFNFSQKHMPKFRKQIEWEIKRGKLKKSV